jgi:hypothetical protein
MRFAGAFQAGFPMLDKADQMRNKNIWQGVQLPKLQPLRAICRLATPDPDVAAGGGVDGCAGGAEADASAAAITGNMPITAYVSTETDAQLD